MKSFIAVLILVVLITACAKEQQFPVRPPAEQPVQPVESADDVLGEVNRTTALSLDDVLCNPEERRITFRFRNNDVKNWQMNQQVPFPEPKDLAAVRVYINSYEVNGRNPIIKEGERMFGPAERFSDNCGGVEVLAPGEDVTCTLQPVPLKAANQLTAGKNEILVHSPTNKHIIQFTCEA